MKIAVRKKKIMGAKKPARAEPVYPQRPGLKFERRAGHPRTIVGGVDEVGRGCLAGPVVAGALVLPEVVDFARDPWLKDVADSKLVSAEDRERLVPRIEAWAAGWAIGVASVEEIDRLNIYHASHLAMERAVEGIRHARSAELVHYLVDGNRLPRALEGRATAVVKGDLQCLSVAAASILAKVFRDRLMREWDARHPEFGFAAHKGYATPVHRAAILARGICEIHRRSFAPVAEALARGPSPLGVLAEREGESPS
jgi:ribonuclease HII